MEAIALANILAAGEDSRHQFKVNITNSDAMAAEMAAFANTAGGVLIIGVDDSGAVIGLNATDIARLNQMVSNVASQSVRPAINPVTENLYIEEKLVMVVTIAEGLNKPYMDNQGIFWVKSDADKRRVTAREELQRMFQVAALLHADEIPVRGSSVRDLDIDYFENFFRRQYGHQIEDLPISLTQLLNNMNLMKNEELNISGMLLFGKQPQFKLPAFIVKAVAYWGTEITAQTYMDSRDITGKLADVFQQSLNFLLSTIHSKQGGQGFNSIGEPEIPRVVLEELLVNALIHRDYFVSAPIRLFVFKNRVEIISPGHLPNNLTVENIKYGNSNMRNPVLASFATSLLPYRGIGSGIMRALEHYPEIDFFDDRENNLFRVVIHRKELSMKY